MSDIKLEDVVVLWDCSRSMVKNAFKTSRLRIAQRVLKQFINSKFNIDPKDRIGIIIYGSRTKKLSNFTADSEKLIESLSKFEIMGRTNLSDGLAFAMQMLVKEIQKVGGKVSRIFIVTDNSKRKLTDRLKKMAKLAKGLNIYIDVCLVSQEVPPDNDVLKKIALVSNGEYAFFKNIKALLRGAKGFASKKITKESEDYFDPNKKSDIPKLISDVAVDVRRPSINEIREMMRGTTNYKCQICYQSNCPTCHSPFYAEGRFCPSCGRPMHLHCAAQWAEKSDFPEKNVFRCPFCYFLLRIPKSVQKLMEVTGGKSIQVIDEDESFGKPVKMLRVPDEDVPKIDDACAYCNIIFSGDEAVYQCSNCKSYYHESCLRKIYEEIKACRVCGGKIE
ncbi:MAG: VWA domain-containing protein [Promethearchaeota archaeon]